MSKELINTLNPYPGNARRGNVDLIANSLAHLGQYRPIVVNIGDTEPSLTRTILAGNHTYQAAKKLGWKEIDVHFVDVDADTAKRIVLVDNKANDASTYETQELVDLLESLPDLDATGFTQDELDDMLKALDGINDEDPPQPETVEGNAILVNCESLADKNTLTAELIARGYMVGDA